LHNHSNNKSGLKQAVAFSLTSRGIPFTYYGTEQYYAGGNDPNNRETLWQSMNTDSDLYQMIGKIHAQRKASQVWNYEQVERYVDDNIFAFSRGNFFVALTNGGNDQQRDITYTPFQDGTEVCNIFYPADDCQTVSNGLNIYLTGGETKIYVPKSELHQSLFESAEFTQ